MTYLIECPACQETVRVQHVTDGIWAISPNNPDCNVCVDFTFAMSNIMDFTENDEEIHAFLESFQE